MNKIRNFSASRTIIAILLVMVSFLCFYPMWYTLIVSFSNKSHVAAGYVVFLPSGFNTLAYTKVLADKYFYTAFNVSVLRVLLGCPINMLLTLLAAYPLSLPSNKFGNRKYYVWFLFFNMMFSGGLIPYYLNIKNFGLIDSIWSLILPGALQIFSVILLMNFFKTIPYELNESAAMDGANPWYILFRIYFPLSLPSIATILLFTFVGHWNSYFDGLILINTPEKQPLQTYIYQLTVKLTTQQMNSEEVRLWAKISNETLNAAKITIALIPMLVVYPFLQKYFVVGLTLGSVKE